MNNILTLNDITKTYAQGNLHVEVLKGVDLTLKAGEVVALTGPSGSGKSTLLHIAGLLDAPTSGSITFGEQKAEHLRDKARTKLRNAHIGFIYQFHHLLPEFTALENVMMPLWLSDAKPDASRAHALIEQVGLGHRMAHRPSELSGGEQQRIAIARALVNRPKLLLADEPTGNLDTENAEAVFDLMIDAIRANGAAAIIATHNRELASQMDRVLCMENGVLRHG